MYIPKYKKYFIMDDECAECEHDWREEKIYHFDLWLGPDHMEESYTLLVGCEHEMSEPGDMSARLNPPRNLPGRRFNRENFGLSFSLKTDLDSILILRHV